MTTTDEILDYREARKAFPDNTASGVLTVPGVSTDDPFPFKPLTVFGFPNLLGFYGVQHDPPAIGLPKLVRITLAYVFLSTGELFVGHSICSEEDTFRRDVGREQAMRRAERQLKKWVSTKGSRGSIMLGRTEGLSPTELRLSIESVLKWQEIKLLKILAADRAEMLKCQSL